MQIDKEAIMGMLRGQGDEQRAADAERELPEQVDTEQDRGLLERLGIDPQEIIGRFTGGGGIPGL